MQGFIKVYINTRISKNAKFLNIFQIFIEMDWVDYLFCRFQIIVKAITKT